MSWLALSVKISDLPRFVPQRFPCSKSVGQQTCAAQAAACIPPRRESGRRTVGLQIPKNTIFGFSGFVFLKRNLREPRSDIRKSLAIRARLRHRAGTAPRRLGHKRSKDAFVFRVGCPLRRPKRYEKMPASSNGCHLASGKTRQLRHLCSGVRLSSQCAFSTTSSGTTHDTCKNSSVDCAST
jgi:hypothetical protein